MGPLGRVFRFWGSTEAERYRAMRGDMEIPHPTYEATLAVTIDAPPSAIWPWLVQMGYRRGGLYSYDWLDRLFGFLDAPSADRLLPEFQHLEAGEEIPIGARILSAVDFLDAMASDRQYRRALPLDDVMARLQEESGKSFDPKVVAVLRRRYVELERQVKLTPVDNPLSKLSTEVKMERDVEPAAGYAKAMSSEAPEAGFLSSIASARQEAQTLLELSQDLGASLSLGETLSVFSVKLRRLVPYDAVAIYVKRNNELLPEYVSGDNFRLFASLRIPLGQGLSGWVAQNKKPIVNGNPSVEPGYMNDPTKFSTLRSALAVPLVGLEGVVGVLALYNADKDAFTADHLRVLLAVSSKMALAVENALK